MKKKKKENSLFKNLTHCGPQFVVDLFYYYPFCYLYDELFCIRLTFSITLACFQLIFLQKNPDRVNEYWKNNEKNNVRSRI